MAEKEKMLRGEPFPPNDGDQYYRLPPAGQAHERITVQVVESALFSQSVKKALGPDKLSFRSIRLLQKWNRTRVFGQNVGGGPNRPSPICLEAHTLGGNSETRQGGLPEADNVLNDLVDTRR